LRPDALALLPGQAAPLRSPVRRGTGGRRRCRPWPWRVPGAGALSARRAEPAWPPPADQVIEQSSGTTGRGSTRA